MQYIDPNDLGGIRIIEAIVEKCIDNVYHFNIICIMLEDKIIEWNKDKNIWLRKERNICFEDIEIAIQEGRIFDVIKHSNTKRYSKQKICIIEFGGYVYKVPFVEDGKNIFLKTAYPCRKMTKKYLNK